MVTIPGRRIITASAGSALVALLALNGFSMPAHADAGSDIVARAKAAVAEYAGPQTTWKGPTSGPKPAKGMKIVYLSGDEQNDISHENGVNIHKPPQRSVGAPPSSTGKAARHRGSRAWIKPLRSSRTASSCLRTRRAFNPQSCADSPKG